MRSSYTLQINMTVTPDEYRQILTDAERNDVSLSNQLRMCCGLPAKRYGRQPRVKRRAITEAGRAAVTAMQE